jgi:uncharacterized membrane protein
MSRFILTLDSGALIMAECTLPTKQGLNPLTISLVITISVLAILSLVLTSISGEFIPFLNGIVDSLLNVATNVLYLIGAGMLILGATLITIRFLQCKLRDPYKPSCVSRYLSGYLSLSLEFFIGAEILKTVVVRSYEEFSLLILVISSRGLFSLIIYLERRWHGTSETE